MNLYIKEAGSRQAPTLVFLHAISTSSWMWEEQLAQLTDFHCLAIDLPGHGQSNTLPWVSLAATAQAVAELIRVRVPGGQAHVVVLSTCAWSGAVFMHRWSLSRKLPEGPGTSLGFIL